MSRRKIPRHRDDQPLELGATEMRALALAVVERVIEHLDQLESQPVSRTAGGRKLARSLVEPLPERGAPLERLLRLVFGKVLPLSLNTAAPGYLGYVPGGGLFPAAVADFIALATNRYTGAWIAAPGLVQLEQNVIRWLCELMGLPATSSGLLTSGGSLANLIALVTARHAHFAASFESARLYTSDQAHHSVLKAARFAGFRDEHVCIVASDARFRVKLDELERSIAEDRNAGRQPFLVVAQAGSTNTGAIDDLPGIAALCQREGLWLHVDAAYGGFFALTARGRSALAGIDHADSITLDPHKGLFLPYGTGCLLVRDVETLRRAHDTRASYMPPRSSDDDLVDFCDLGPELSREARGLRVWLPLKLHGAQAFRDALDEKLALARWTHDVVAARPDIEVAAPPALSLFAFRHRPAGVSDEVELERINRLLLRRINDLQRVFVAGTTLHGKFFVRLCVLSFRTHRVHLERFVEDLDAALRR